MAGRIAYYGNIVTNGLVLDLDAGKRDSYPGSGTTWRDISGRGNNASLINGPTFGSDNFGTIIFDGTNDYGYSSTLSLANIDFTISCWLKATDISVTRVYYNMGGAASTRALLHLRLTSATSMRFGMWVDDLDVTLPLNVTTQWTYLTVTFDSTNTQRVYQNTTLAGSRQAGGRFVGSSDQYIGSWRGTAEYFYGNMSNIQVYNRALSSTEITQNYNALKSRYGL